jgi:glycosyltransferase involved in cell wall biosynthesis
MQLSIIIPCFNATGFIGDLLYALSRQVVDFTWEVIIADNGANENLNTIVDSYRDTLPPISVIDATSKKRASFARNSGAHHARGKYLIFIDADDVVGENWLKNIAASLVNYDFVASRLEFNKLNTKTVLKYRGNFQESGLLQFSIVSYLPFSGASGLGIRKDIHDLSGGFDENMKYVEDADYCWKVQRAGYKLYFAHEAVIHVRYRNTIWKNFLQAKNYGEYYVFLYKKYLNYDIPVQNKKKGIREWKKILKDIPSLHKNENRALWFRRFGEKLGRIKGSIKYGIFVP